MAAEDILLGPFVSGLDTSSDPSSIEDTALAECINFEVDTDGSLVSRPPIEDLEVLMPLGTGGSRVIKLLGHYTSDSGGVYLIGSNGNSNTYAFNGTQWVNITNTFAASSMVQFRGRAYLLAPLSSANPGGYWTPDGGFTAVADMPKGEVITAMKERLWIGLGKNALANGTRLYLSDLDSGGNILWNGSYIDIGQGDGQNIIDLCVYYSDLIIFKRNSTYRFAYSSDPAVGEIQRISDTIGASDTNCWASHENQLYVLSDNRVYLFSNYNYTRLNHKVPLEALNPLSIVGERASISVWADRLFVAYYDRTFVYSLKTRTWTEWRSDVVPYMGRIISMPIEQDKVPFAYTYSTEPERNGLYRILDRRNTSVGEEFTCSMRTKIYDYQVSHRYKRLTWWSVDVLSNNQLHGFAIPVAFARAVTWEQVANNSWNELRTWERPIEISLETQDTVEMHDTTGERKAVKFMIRSGRFRQIAFRLQANVDGTNRTSPLRIFKILTMVKDKQTVSKRIS